MPVRILIATIKIVLGSLILPLAMLIVYSISTELFRRGVNELTLLNFEGIAPLLITVLFFVLLYKYANYSSGQLCGTFVLSILLACSLFIDVVPPSCLTDGCLTCTYIRIQTFWNEHGKVPATPAELPDRKGYDCSMKDGWGRELYWESNGKDHVRVWSLGRDEKPGGTGEDADIGVEFVGRQKEQHDTPVLFRGNDVKS